MIIQCNLRNKEGTKGVDERPVGERKDGRERKGKRTRKSFWF
jgi:hypothetical protein